MKKIIFLFISLCFVFSFNVNFASASQVVVSEDGSLLNRNNKLQRSYEESKNDFQDSVQKYKETKKNFSDAKTRFQNKRDDVSRRELKKGSFNYFDKIGVVMIKYLESLENKIQNIKFVSEDVKNEMIGKISENRSIIEKEIEKIKAVETIEDQRVLVRELKSQWKDIRASTKNITGQIISAKIDVFISKMKKVSEEFQVKVGAMENGERKDLLQAKVEKFDEKIELAESQNQLAQGKFLEINNADQKNDLFKEGLKFVRSAHQYIKEAHKELIGIAQEIREEKKSDEEDNSSADEETSAIETDDNLSDEDDNESEESDVEEEEEDDLE
ncbi:hypothetical protein KAJ41_00725 [Candidatus Parcubacteria bacterium]|nr:hypothetical protein [Candidatus Parcubacteria bacterium]